MGTKSPFSEEDLQEFQKQVDFSEKETMEETEEETTEETMEETEEETTEETMDETMEETEEETDNKVEKATKGIRAALTEQRARTKTAEDNSSSMAETLDTYKRTVDAYKKALTTAKEDADESGLEDIITIKIPDIDVKAEKQKEEQQNRDNLNQAMTSIKSEVTANLDKYKSIDIDNADMGVLLTSGIMLSMMSGREVAESSEVMMKSMDKLLSDAFQRGRKSRAPAIKPKGQVSRSGKKHVKDNVSQMVKKGNISGVFDSIAGRMVSEK